MSICAFGAVRNKFFFAVDLLLLPSATLLAYAIRFEDTPWPAAAPRVLTAFIIASLPLKLLVLYMAGIYRPTIIRYTNAQGQRVPKGTRSAKRVRQKSKTYWGMVAHALPKSAVRNRFYLSC